MTHVFIEALQPGRLLSINMVSGQHWARINPTKKRWFEAGYWYGIKWRGTFLTDRVETPLRKPATIYFDFDVPVKRRRDGHNYSGTVCKWFIDGLVSARVLKDDSTEYLTLVDPTFSPGTGNRMRVRLEVADDA